MIMVYELTSRLPSADTLWMVYELAQYLKKYDSIMLPMILLYLQWVKASWLFWSRQIGLVQSYMYMGGGPPSSDRRPRVPQIDNKLKGEGKYLNYV